jgi:large subunit ribosomal protein L1
VPIGKKSFGADKLLDNARALIDSLVKAKPAAAKATIYAPSRSRPTQGPGIKIDPNAVRTAAAPEED